VLHAKIRDGPVRDEPFEQIISSGQELGFPNGGRDSNSHERVAATIYSRCVENPRFGKQVEQRARLSRYGVRTPNQRVLRGTVDEEDPFRRFRARISRSRSAHGCRPPVRIGTLGAMS
jgi:hypothetical protein